MYCIYILKLFLPKVIKNLYIGLAEDLKGRCRKHEQGLVRATKNLRPLKLIYYQTYLSKKDALIREKRLQQHAQDLIALKSRLGHSLMLSG